MQKPLADRIRPCNISEVSGQQHLLSEGKALRRIIDSGNIPNLIFYGPSGVGKTTVASIIAAASGKKLYQMNATTSGTADIKDMLLEIGTIEAEKGILLYLDEIQYFNKKQQQTLLEHIENGNVTLIASTTENPYFYVYNAILSRSTIFEFKPLSSTDIEDSLHRAVVILAREEKLEILFESGAFEQIALAAGGDVRKALNALELCAISADRDDTHITITLELCRQLSQKSSMRYDRQGDEHYDILSAFQKSMRGSDPDAALHYLARLLEAGDLISACRRLMVCAAEDVGLAWPQILSIVKSAVDMANMLGMPEARIPLADAVVLVAISPKSNSAYKGIDRAIEDIKNGLMSSIPRNLQNKHFDGADNDSPGQFYKYTQDFPNHYVKQQYLPDKIKNKTYYRFGDNKNEQAFKRYFEETLGINKNS